MWILWIQYLAWGRGELKALHRELILHNMDVDTVDPVSGPGDGEREDGWWVGDNYNERKGERGGGETERRRE